MHKLISLTLSVLSATAYAGGNYDRPRHNPLQPNAYANADASSHSNSSSTSKAYGGTGGSGGAGGHSSATGGSAHGGSASASIASGAVSVANDATGGNVGDINIVNPRQHRLPVNTAIAPDLAAGADTCLGSASGAVQGSAFGLSLGKTVRDTNCERIRNAKLYAALGDYAAMYATQCADPAQREALTLSGISCTPEFFARMRASQQPKTQQVTATVAPAPVAVAVQPCARKQVKRKACR